jgi:hypothetical protein
MKHEGDWWLGGFVGGFIIGFMLGFFYTRLAPLPPTPAQLDPADQDIYLVLVAAAYRHDGDFAKAQRRLIKLRDSQLNQTIAVLGESYIAANADIRDIRALAHLSQALGETQGALLVYLSTPTFTPMPLPILSPTPTVPLTPTNTSTPLPPTVIIATPTETALPKQTTTISATPTPTITLRITSTPGPNAPYGLAQSIALCDNTANGILRVYVRDRFGVGVPGVEVLVSWPGGQDRFFTGFKSEDDFGYADFQMEIEQTYRVELQGVPTIVVENVNEAATTRCPDLPVDAAPSWQVVFRQGASQE